MTNGYLIERISTGVPLLKLRKKDTSASNTENVLTPFWVHSKQILI